MNERCGRLLVPALVVSVAAAGLFGVLAWCVHTQNALTELDAQLAADLHQYKQASPSVASFFEKVTHVGSMETLVMVLMTAALVGLRWRRWWVVAAWLVLLIGGEYLNKGLKAVFQRPRPPFSKSGDWSFPSGHAMMAMIGYGMLAYLLVLLWPHRALRIALVLLLVLLIGFSRLLLGAHYLSDVLGGFAAGAACLGAWVAGLEAVRATGRSASGAPTDRCGSASGGRAS